MTLQEAKNFIDESFSDYFTYGIEGSDLGTPVSRMEAMLDLARMDEYDWNCGDILECDEDGNLI